MGMDKQGQVLIGCRKCSGYARQRMGLTLMNCCNLEQVGTKEHGKMLRQVLEEDRFPANEATNWRLEGQKRRTIKKDIEYCGMSSRREVSWRRKDYGMLPERICWKIEVHCPKKMDIN